MCECNINIHSIENNFKMSSIKVVVEKECGYAFLIYLNESSTMIDLYRYVELFYTHTNDNKLLFNDLNRKNIIYKSDIKIIDYININNIKRNKKYDNNYLFYLSLLH